MAISIGITANANAVKSALGEIKDAIARAGQAGKEFSQLDLSHPELQTMAQDIRQMQNRFEELGRVGRGATATAFRHVQRAGGGADPLAWQFAAGHVFPDDDARAHHTATVGRYIFSGTRWQQSVNQQNQPQPAQPAQPPGGGGGGGTGGMLGMLGGGLGSMGGMVAGGLALAGISGVKQMISASIGKAQDEAIAADTFMRHLNEGGGDFAALRDAVRESTKGMQINYQEGQRLSLMWAKLTNDASPGAVSAGMRLGAGFARSYGIDPAAGVQAMGRAAYMGMDQNRFAVLAGEAARTGGQSGQIEQVMQSLLRWSEGATRTLITHTNVGEFAAMYAGLNATGMPGFKGEAGASFIEGLNRSLSGGGSAGMAGNAFMFRALQQQGVTDPYAQQMLRESGMFATAKGTLGYGSDTSVFDAVRQRINQEYPGTGDSDRLRRLHAMANLTGTNMPQMMALETGFKGPADLGVAFRALDKAQIKLENVNPTSLRDIGAIAGASGAGLEEWRTNLLNRSGSNAIGAEDRKMLTGAAGDDLRTALLQLTAKYGLQETEGTKTREAMVDLSNAMTKVGTDLLPILNDIKSGSAALVGALGEAGQVIGDVYRAGAGDPLAKARLMDQTGVSDLGRAFLGDKEAQGRLRTANGMIGADEPGLTDAVKKSRAAQALTYFQSQEGGGWSRSQALGIVAQAGAESSFQAHGARGDGGQAVGAFQWHPDRQAAIKQRFGKSVEDMTWEEQMAAKAWELSPGGPEAAAGQSLRGETTAFGAGYRETVADQRPSYSMVRGVQRGSFANQLDSQLQSEPQAVHITHEPLEIVLKDGSGRQIGSEKVPSTIVRPPQPWGPTASDSGTWGSAGDGGQPEIFPPPPPPSPEIFPSGRRVEHNMFKN